MIDIILINPGNKKEIYQNLYDLSAYEPPYLIASFAQFLRNNGVKVGIIDANVLNLSPKECAKKAKELNPKVCAVIVYGNQPSASTQNMDNAVDIVKELKNLKLLTAIGGLHPSALPEQTLMESEADFVIEGEEQIPLLDLVKFTENEIKLEEIRGVWYKKGNKIYKNKEVPLIQDLDTYLPIAAWDLLPMEKYKAHNWHCFGKFINDRYGYAAIYTSLGCPYKCTFCCINAIFKKNTIRYRSPKLVVDEIELLVNKYRVKHLKIIDEMFILDENHYMGIAEEIVKRNIKANIWAYARVDTIKISNLKTLKKAGFNWLCLGIESASEFVRNGAKKKLRFNDIEKIVKNIQEAGINVLANYMFGLEDDDFNTMEETLCFAKKLNTEFANFYSAMAYPGSKLYEIAKERNYTLPERWGDFSQHSYNQIPLPTKYLTPKEVLEFRDYAWKCYFSNPKYLTMIKNKFGIETYNHVKYMASKKLQRWYERED